ncbi:MAG: biopolymer transporter ExbD [Gammaproteobacteria bacterium]
MNLRGKRREDPEVNLTPLIDVVFLLLIFFMVSTTFKHEADLKVQLPEASAKPEAVQQNRLEVVIDAKGQFFVNDKRLVNRRVNTLKRALQEAAGGRKNLPLVIRADGRTPHQAVVTAMDAAAQLGIVHLSIATVHANEP